MLAVDELAWFNRTKITSFSTWYKYKAIYHPNIYLAKLKEDCCDTCMKYDVAMQDPNISEVDKRKIKEARNVSSMDA
jgi:hypothetical protein